MAMVDTGLGFACDDSILLTEAGTVVAPNLTKVNEGLCIAIWFVFTNGACGPVLLYPIYENVFCKGNREHSNRKDFYSNTPGVFLSIGIPDMKWSQMDSVVFRPDTNPLGLLKLYERDGDYLDQLANSGLIIGEFSTQEIPVQFNRSGGVLSDSFEITVYPS